MVILVCLTAGRRIYAKPVKQNHSVILPPFLDDDVQGDSNSIQNQKKLLSKYAKEYGFSSTKHFVDDGFTGTNFNRPGFTEMMAAVEAGYIEAILVKDMSRLGRDYLQVGFYTELL